MEAKGLVGKVPAEKRGVFARPEMQERWKDRLKKIEPYKDIVKEVEEKCHGKGAARRIREKIAHLEREPQRKNEELTGLDHAANAMAISRCTRHASCSLHNPEEWPIASPEFPEVAFIGRSNVGKSTLLNRVSMFGTVASVSSTPGHTRHVCWHRNRKVKFDVLDMPGYGFAERSKLFGPAAIEFVKRRTSLAGLYVLIDARHGFISTDHNWLGELGNSGPMKQIVLTKCDMVPPKKLIKIASLVRSDLQGHKRVEQKILMVSSFHLTGLRDLRLDIARRCGKENFARKLTTKRKDKFPFEINPVEKSGPRPRQSPKQRQQLAVPDDDGWDRALGGGRYGTHTSDDPSDPINDPNSAIRRIIRRVEKGARHV